MKIRIHIKDFFMHIHACMYVTLISDMRSSKIPDIQNSAKGGRCGWSQNILKVHIFALIRCDGTCRNYSLHPL